MNEGDEERESILVLSSASPSLVSFYLDSGDNQLEKLDTRVNVFYVKQAVERVNDEIKTRQDLNKGFNHIYPHFMSPFTLFTFSSSSHSLPNPTMHQI